MSRRPTTPEAGAARFPAPGVRIGRRAAGPPRRFGPGAVASLALHAGAAAAVAAAAAWRAAPVAPPPASPVQVVWLDARPPAEPSASAPIEAPRPRHEAALPAAPMGEAVTEGLEPEDMLATMLPDPVAPRPDDRPATAEAPPPPTLSELMAAGDLPVPEPADAPAEGDLAAPPPRPPAVEEAAAPEHRSTALAALAVPPPAAPSRPPPPAASPPPARRGPPQPPHRPDAAAAPARRSPSPRPPLPPAAAAAASVPSPVPAQAPLVQGPPRFRRPPSPPDYPAQARDRGEEGMVGLRLLVGADGTTREVRVHRSSGNRLLDQAALAAARRWEVEPASLDGRRAEAWVEVPVRFRLDR